MIKLAKPPSINHIYGLSSKGGFARSYITKAGKDWFDKGIDDLVTQHPFGQNFPIQEKIYLIVHLYTARMQDIDNILKPTLDLIANMCLDCKSKYTSRRTCVCGKNRSLLEDDVQIFKLLVEKHKVKHREEEKIEIDIRLILDKDGSI